MEKDLFKVLADPGRRRIVELIALWGKITAQELLEHTEMKSANLSLHMKSLKEAGLVRVTTTPRHHIYSIDMDGLLEVSGWVGRVVNASRTRVAIGNGRIPEQNNQSQ